MKTTIFCITLALFFFISGCDPFSEDELPASTVVLQSPLNGELQLGVPFNLRATVRTAYPVDSLVIDFNPPSNSHERYTMQLPIPETLRSVNKNEIVEAKIDVEVTLEALPVNGFTNYMLGVISYVQDNRPVRRGWYSGRVRVEILE